VSRADGEGRRADRALIEGAAAALKANFGARALTLAAAPGRVNLIGEHTDYNLGFVLPMAIDRWCVVAAAPGPRAGEHRVHSVQTGSTLAGPVLAESHAGAGWSAYPLGALAELARYAGIRDPRPLDLAINSGVPLGSGLSSSASLLVAVVTAAAAAWGVELGPLVRARIAQRAEHVHAGVPCGIMDPAASSMGEAGHALLIDCADETIRTVRLPPGVGVLVGDTGVRHALAGGEYAARRRSCEAAARALGAASLRDVTPERLEADAGLLQDDQLACARHVLSENRRVLEFVERVSAGDARGAGALMGASHRSLRDDFRVSCPELDAMVEIASGLPGVLGSRMTGGGFGGCTVTLCESASVDRFARDLSAKYRERTGRDGRVFAVEPVAGAGKIEESIGGS
jgi:galactokinase